MTHTKLITIIAVLFAAMLLTFCNQDRESVTYVTVAEEAGYFLGWPANNGGWIWDDGEMVVGYTMGTFAEKDGHNIDRPYHNKLARSSDGGSSWDIIDEEGFIGIYDPENEAGRAQRTLQELEEPLNFNDENFMMRVIANGYLQPDLKYPGSDASEGGFYYSYDRGRTWSGPFVFNGLSQAEALDGLEITSRTDYLVESDRSALMFFSARTPGVSRTDKVFVARTDDGGMSFEFVSWMVDPADPYRAVMPSTKRTDTGKLVSAVRRRVVDGSEYCWIDIYASTDNGETWNFVSRGGETGFQNGSPPALLKLQDGRLLLAYANREHHQIRARFSTDDGLIWGPEIILRDGPERDIGYPRLFQNSDGNIVTIYYWAESPDSEKYIEAVIWDPGDENIIDQPVKLFLEAE